MPYLVAAEELDRYPALKALSPAQRRQALADAEALYRVIVRNPWLTEDALRQQAAGRGITADRVTRALGLLLDAKRVATVADEPPPAAAAPLPTVEPTPDPTPAPAP